MTKKLNIHAINVHNSVTIHMYQLYHSIVYFIRSLLKIFIFITVVRDIKKFAISALCFVICSLFLQPSSSEYFINEKLISKKVSFRFIVTIIGFKVKSIYRECTHLISIPLMVSETKKNTQNTVEHNLPVMYTVCT